MSEFSSLEQSILASLCFFDIFDYPLTLFELWKWRYPSNQQSATSNQPFKISDILEILESQKLEGVIEKKNGFYFLKGREKIIQTRSQRARLAEEKFRKTLRLARLLSLVPFVRMIAVSNDLAYNNAPEGSDIDFFIVIKPGRIWMARFFLVFFLKLFRARPTPKEKKDKFCLSFFITEDNLDLESIAFEEDIYLAHWISQLVPIYNEKETYQKFLQANQWTKKFLPDALPVFLFRRSIRHNWFWRTKKKAVEWINSFAFNGISERFYRWLQLKILPEELKKLANKSTAVIVSDKMLKFHKIDQREYFQRKFEEKLKWVLTKYRGL